MIAEYLKIYKDGVIRNDIEKLLEKKLPDILTDKQKKIKINNLISKMRDNGVIINLGSRTKSKWFLKIT